MSFFVIPGKPIPKQRPRVVRGRAYTPKPTREYERKVGFCARQARVRMSAGPFSVKISLYFSDFRRRDIDNCAKAILDALTGIAWVDDSEVDQLSVCRGFDRDNPRAEITIKRLKEEER